MTSKSDEPLLSADCGSANSATSIAVQLQPPSPMGTNTHSSGFPTNFLRPHHLRRAEYQRISETNQLVQDVRDMMLNRLDPKRANRSIRALQDPQTLSRVVNKLHQTSSSSVLPSKFKFKRPSPSSASSAEGGAASSPSSNSKPPPTKKIATIKCGGGKRYLKKSSVGRRKNNRYQLARDIMNPSRRVEPDPSKDEGDSLLHPLTRLSLDEDRAEPGLEIPCLSDNVSGESSGPGSPLVGLLPELNFTPVGLNNTLKINEELLPKSHKLEATYANQLRRRQALARREAVDKSSKSNHSPPTPASPEKESFNPELPLDKQKHRLNPLKKCLGFLNPKRNLSSSSRFGSSQYRTHHLQRAHVPVELIQNIPVNEQVRCFINTREVEAYRRSGMTYLDLGKLGQASPSNASANPSPHPRRSGQLDDREGVSPSLHDIWYDDLNPPLDAVSVYVYWWGYEVYLPKEVLDQLRKQGSATNSLLGFISVLTSAVPLIQPFIKILTAFISMESSASDLFHSPQGTVLTAIWLLPFLVIPRAWY